MNIEEHDPIDPEKLAAGPAELHEAALGAHAGRGWLRPEAERDECALHSW